jgi:hypothetical protein
MSCPSLVEIKQQGVLGNMMGALRRMLGVIGISKSPYLNNNNKFFKRGKFKKTLTAINKTPIKETLF